MLHALRRMSCRSFHHEANKGNSRGRPVQRAIPTLQLRLQTPTKTPTKTQHRHRHRHRHLHCRRSPMTARRYAAWHASDN